MFKNNSKFEAKYELFFKKLSDREKIRKEHKIWLWLLLCPPVGLYKAFKYKAINRIFLSIVSALFVLIIALSLDNFINPNRVTDYMITQNIQSYKSSDLGKVRRISKMGTIDDKYYIYNVLTTTGNYDVYLSGDGNLDICGINQISPNKTLFLNSDLDYLKDISPAIINFMNIKSNKDKYGEIKENIKKSQLGNTIKTTKGIFVFIVEKNQVLNVYTKEGDTIKTLYEAPYEVKIPSDMLSMINENKAKIGEIKQVISDDTNNTEESYIFLSTNGNYYKIVKSLNGDLNIYKQSK